jgi:iron complex transport system substrate-binding protein
MQGLACIAAATHPALHPTHPSLIQLRETEVTGAEASSDPDPSPAFVSSPE